MVGPVSGKLFIISAPSGAGKTTLVNAILNEENIGRNLERVITYSSKRPRPGEINGRDYHFVSHEEFERLIEQEFFIEWSSAYGAYYGSPASIIDRLASGKSFIMILDRTGAQAIKAAIKNAILIWIQVPTLEDLRARLHHRGQDLPDSVERRLVLAEKEIQNERDFPVFEQYVMNNNFENAVQQLKNIIALSLNKQ